MIFKKKATFYGGFLVIESLKLYYLIYIGFGIITT